MDQRNRTRSAAGDDRANAHFAIGADRRIVEWDDAAARLLGVPSDQALGSPCDRVIGGRDDFGRAVCGTACPALKALAAGDIAATSRLLARAADGTRVRLACDLTALPAGGALGRLGSAAGAVPDLAYDLAGIAALTTRAAGEPLPQGLRHALDFLLHATAADAGEAFLAEPHGRGMVLSCHRGSFERAFDPGLRFDAGAGFPGLALAHRQPVYTARLADDPRFLRSRVAREGFSSYVCAPLASGDAVPGCFALAFRRRDVDLDRVLHLLRSVSTPLGLVIDAALNHLRDAAIAPLRVVQGGTPQRLPRALRALLQEMVRIGRADAGEVWLPWFGADPALQVPDAGALPRCAALDDGAGARCPAFAGGVTSILHGRRDGWPAGCREVAHPGGAWCCIPMSCDGQSQGLVRLLYRRLRPSPPHEHVALIEGLASLAAEQLRELRDRWAQPAGASEPRHGLRSRDPAAGKAQAQTGSRSIRVALPAAGALPQGAAPLEIRCFGALEVSVDGVCVPPAAIRRKRVLTLLGILLSCHDRPQCKDALIELLWPGADPQVRTRQFRVLVHELRRLLEPRSRGGNWRYLRNQGDRYALDTRSGCRIDTLEFGALIERGRAAEAAGDEPAAIDAYEAAVELYRGDYLPDEPFAEWCSPLREQLRETCLAALVRLGTLWGGRARWDRSVAWSRRALQLDPLREDSHRALMHALWASGRRDEAVRQYEACAHLLRERLDLAPMPETEQLYARIRAHPRP